MLKNTTACALLLVATTAEARDLAVPAIGCPSDGQVGPEPAPTPGTVYLPLEADLATKLTYYRASELGVLGPRGWHCVRLYGSNGSFLLVTPNAIKAEQVLSPAWPGISGPGIQLSVSIGETSGRFSVAPIAARIFPQAQKFVASVSAELRKMNMPALSGRPWPTDRLKRVSGTVVEYVTPANSDGLGTQGRLKKNDSGIAGVAILTGDDYPDLTLLSVRLYADSTQLVPLIVRQVESSQKPGTHP